MWFGNRVNGLGGGAVLSIDVADCDCCVVLLSTFYHPAAASCGKGEWEHNSQLGTGIGETRFESQPGEGAGMHPDFR